MPLAVPGSAVPARSRNRPSSEPEEAEKPRPERHWHRGSDAAPLRFVPGPASADWQWRAGPRATLNFSFVLYATAVLWAYLESVPPAANPRPECESVAIQRFFQKPLQGVNRHWQVAPRVYSTSKSNPKTWQAGNLLASCATVSDPAWVTVYTCAL